MGGISSNGVEHTGAEDVLLCDDTRVRLHALFLSNLEEVMQCVCLQLLSSLEIRVNIDRSMVFSDQRVVIKIWCTELDIGVSWQVAALPCYC